MAHLTCVGSSYAEATRADPRVPRRRRHELPRAARRSARRRRRGGRCTSATWAAPASSCSSSTACRRSGCRSRCTTCPASRAPSASARASASRSPSPRSRTGTRGRGRSAQDIDTLLAKQAAGANLAITQLFFHADDYLAFVDAARAAGVTMRILPGHHAGAEHGPAAARARADRRGAAARAHRARSKRAESPEAAAAVGIDFTHRPGPRAARRRRLRAPPLHFQPL